MEFYAAHRMTDDRRLRIYASGRTEDALQTSNVGGPGHLDLDRSGDWERAKCVAGGRQTVRLVVPVALAVAALVAFIARGPRGREAQTTIPLNTATATKSHKNIQGVRVVLIALN